MKHNFYDLKEPGVNPAKSLGFFFTPMPITQQYYYYIIECGHYYVDNKDRKSVV